MFSLLWKCSWNVLWDQEREVRTPYILPSHLERREFQQEQFVWAHWIGEKLGVHSHTRLKSLERNVDILYLNIPVPVPRSLHWPIDVAVVYTIAIKRPRDTLLWVLLSCLPLGGVVLKIGRFRVSWWYCPWPVRVAGSISETGFPWVYEWVEDIFIVSGRREEDRWRIIFWKPCFRNLWYLFWFN